MDWHPLDKKTGTSKAHSGLFIDSHTSAIPKTTIAQNSVNVQVKQMSEID
jgi:hypothetical protein